MRYAKSTQNHVVCLGLLVICFIMLPAAVAQPRVYKASAAAAEIFTIEPVRDLYQMSTDADAVVGSTYEGDAFTITCSLPQDSIAVTVTSDNPAFRIDLQQVFCGSVNYAQVQFTPKRSGITTAQITINSSAGSATVTLIGNGIVSERVPYWITDLGPGTSASSVLYDDQRQLLYITDIGNNQVIVFSPAQRTVRKRIEVGQKPAHLARTSDNKKLYVTNTGEFSLSVIDLDTQIAIEQIPLPSLYPNPTAPYQQLYTPYAIAIVSDTLALLGSNPPGAASGGPIYQLDLQTRQVSPRLDTTFSQAARPVLRTSRDFSTVGIVVEPGSSPTGILRYDKASNTFARQQYEIERSLAINNEGTRIVTTFYDCNTLIPNLSLFDEQMRLLGNVQTVGCQTLAVVFNPVDQQTIYGLDDRTVTIEEVRLDATSHQTRVLPFDVPEGYFFQPFSEPLTISGDGRWVYTPLVQTFNAPPSKLLALYVGPLARTYLPVVAR